MKLVKPNWYGFDHAKVNQMFSGGLTFVNDFCVNGEYEPSAVYRAANPDTSKGHKRYMLLTKNNGQFYVRGMDEQQIEPFRYQDALHCCACGDVIYSVNRHDFRSCSCGNVSIDGGRDYTRTLFSSKAPFEMAVVDLLTDAISDPKPLGGKKKKKAKKAKAKDSGSTSESAS
jgi:hypothetical protein